VAEELTRALVHARIANVELARREPEAPVFEHTLVRAVRATSERSDGEGHEYHDLSHGRGVCHGRFPTVNATTTTRLARQTLLARRGAKPKE
jgi:hypothetical protein